MIPPQDQLFANLITQLQRDLPVEPLRRLVNLAAVAVGVLRSKSLQVGQLVTALPLEGTRDTLKKRGQRFGKNPGVTVEVSAEPGARRLLQRLVGGGARIHLTLDRTEWGTFHLLYVCVGWRGRALPLLWTPLGPGASSVAEQQALLALVARWLPARANVLLLGDREFGTGVLAQWALQQGWGGVCACGPMNMCAAPGPLALRGCRCGCLGTAASGPRSPSPPSMPSRASIWPCTGPPPLPNPGI